MPSHLFPPLPSLHSCTLAWLVLVLCIPVPKLKLTYTQIKERAARDIRNITVARQAQLQLHRATLVHKVKQTEDFEQTDIEVEDTEQKGFSYKAQLFFLFLLLVFLLYHAGKQTKKV